MTYDEILKIQFNVHVKLVDNSGYISAFAIIVNVNCLLIKCQIPHSTNNYCMYQAMPYYK